MKHIILSLVVIMLWFPFQSLVQAETTDINDYKEYDSFMKRYHEHTMELSYFINTSYNSNDHYFRENFEEFRNVINSVYDTNKNEFITKYLDSSEELFSKPIALLGTLNDLRGLLWGKVKDFFSKEEILPEYNFTGASMALTLPSEYLFKLHSDGSTGPTVLIQTEASCDLVRLTVQSKSLLYTQFSNVGKCDFYNGSSSEVLTEIKKEFKNVSLSTIYKLYMESGTPINFDVIRVSDNKPIEFIKSSTPSHITNIYNNISTALDKDGRFNQDYMPVVAPQLVCPNQILNLTYTDGLFKSPNGEIIVFNENEQINYLDTLCNLDFSFPEVYFHDDTGSLIVGGESLVVVPPLEPIDNSVVEYIRNSYNYATSVINSGVNGLKSIVNGTSGLIAFTGSIFGFLPSEIMTLFVSGFAIALGLWVFKR